MALVSPAEMLLVALAVIALIVGPKKLPQIARALGESKKEYKKSMKEAEQTVEEMEEDAEGDKDEEE